MAFNPTLLAERELPSGWVTLSLGIIAMLIGVGAAADFRGILKRYHDRVAPRDSGGSFFASIEFQRLIGVFFALFGAVAVVTSLARLF